MRVFLYGLFASVVSLIALLPSLAGAATSTCADCPTSVGEIISLITAIVERLQIIFWVVAAGSALYAAFLYIRGGSSTETLKKAQKQILYTVIAVALGVMAFGIPALIESFLALRAN